VRSKTGRVLVVKGDTHKDKTLQREFTEREDGSIAETRILTDKFVPVIRAWDMTPGSADTGRGVDHPLIASLTARRFIRLHATTGPVAPRGAVAPSSREPFHGSPSTSLGQASGQRFFPGGNRRDLALTPWSSRASSTRCRICTATSMATGATSTTRQAAERCRAGVRRGPPFSSYQVAPGLRLWIITEWDRSVTTLLLPSEY
jgi:hypothetical protein